MTFRKTMVTDDIWRTAHRGIRFAENYFGGFENSHRQYITVEYLTISNEIHIKLGTAETDN